MSATPGTIDAMEAQMVRWLGTGEPNEIQRWYQSRNGNAYAGNWPWCDATITRAAVDSGCYDAVCFGTDYAYTVAHAQRFNVAGAWHPMVNGVVNSGIRRGDIVFFDWAGSSSIGAIDHVGFVTGVSGSTVYTIEGNIGNVCARKVRYVHDIAGFGRPVYKTAPKPAPASKPVVSLKNLIAAYKHDRPAAQGATSHPADVKPFETALKKLGYLSAKYASDGSYGTSTETAFHDFRVAYSRKHKLGWSEADCSGAPGSASLKGLAAESGVFTAKA